VLLAVTVLKLIVGMFANSLDYYLLVYYVFEGNIATGSVWKAILTSAAAATGVLCIRPLRVLSERTDKQTALLAAFGLFAVSGGLKWLVFQPGHRWLLLIDPLVSAPAWIASAILLPSMLADVCDEDELQTGERREGLYGSMLLWVQKVGAAVALFFSGLALNWVGFDVVRGADQASEVMWRIRLILSGVTAGCALLAMTALWRYPIGRGRAERMRAELAGRRGS
jgi:GPH family glycoside/pentoside/hexuronide:cation symporter